MCENIGRPVTSEDINYINLNKDLIDYYSFTSVDSIFGVVIKIGDKFEYFQFKEYDLYSEVCLILRYIELRFIPLKLVIEMDEVFVLEVKGEYIILHNSRYISKLYKADELYDIILEQYNLNLLNE